MKNLIIKILILLLLININTRSFAQWETVYSFWEPGFYGINSIYFFDYNNGIAAGAGVDTTSTKNVAIIVKTMDSGLTWDTLLFSLDSASFQQIFVTNDSTFIAVGAKGDPLFFNKTGMIARTTDYGNSWDIKMVNSPLLSLFFPNDSIGYAVGRNGLILKTIDAGTNWINISPDTISQYSSVLFINDTIGFACRYDSSIIIKTSDGGNNWLNTFIGGFSPPENIFFSSDSIGYFILNDFDSLRIFKTSDGGNTWNLYSTIYTSPSISNDLLFINDTTGYLVGQFFILKTEDGGKTWVWQVVYPDIVGDDLMDVFFLNEDTGFAAGLGQFYKTTNGGECLQAANFSFTDSLLTVYFNDSMFNSTNWLWYFGDGDTSTLQNPIHTYDSAGTYNVCLTVTSICDTVTICDSITLTCPKPISLFDYTDSLLTVNFSDSSTGATSWFWDFGDGNTDTTKNPTYTYSNPGTYSVFLVVTNTCGSDTTTQMVTVDVLGINEKWLSYKIKLYPNPNDGKFFIRYSIPDKQSVEFIIFDVMGRKLKTFQLEGGIKELNIAYKELKNGLYSYQVIVNNRVILTDKLVIIK